MPNWKKLVTSGSDARLNSINVETFVSASSFVGDGSGLTGLPTQTLDLSEIDQHIIPQVDNVYDLGSPTKQWRDLYLSSASLYIDGTKVISSDSNTLTFTTDEGQSIKLLETGGDDITLQTDTGNIELKGTVEIQSGKKITDSAGTKVLFGDSLGITGSIDLTGTVDGIDLQAFSASVALGLSNTTADYTELTNIPAGIVSSSSQITITESQISDLVHYTDSDVKTKLNSEGVVSGSSQVDYNSIQNTPTTISTQQASEITANTAKTGITAQQASDITANNAKVGYTDTLVKTKLNTEGVISGSSQLTITQSQISDVNATATELNYVEGVTSNIQTQLDTKQAVGSYVTTTSIQALSSATNALTFAANTLTLTRGDGSTDTVNLSAYLDDTNLARVISGTYNSSNQELVFTRDDATTFTIDASMFFDDTNLVTSVGAGSGISVNQTTGGVTVTNTAQNVSTNLSTTANSTSLTINSSDGTNASIPAATTGAWGAMTDEDKTKLDGIATSANNYSHPIHPGDNFSVDSGLLTGATVISDIDINVTTDTSGHVTDANGVIATRTLTLVDLGYTGATNANNYVHPSYAGDDINLDTGILTGATVISDLDFNITTDTNGHVTDANATYATRNLTKSDIQLNNVENIAITSYTGNGGALDNQYIANGAGYITSYVNTQLSTEQVQDIAGPLVATGGTKTGIAVTYDDVNGNMDFVVASQTEQNFTTLLKNKLDGIAAGATTYTANQAVNTTSRPTFTSIDLAGTTNPEITFNGSSDGGIDMAIKATPEGLDFYEPEDTNKIHFQILDDSGVNAVFGLQVGGTSVITSGRTLQNVGGNISMFTNDLGYLTSFDITTQTDSKYVRSDVADTASNLTVDTLTVGSSNKLGFSNNDYIRYDDTNGVGRFHFDSDGGTNNASVQAALFVGALSGNASSATNADTVDNLHASSFLRSDTSDTMNGSLHIQQGSSGQSSPNTIANGLVVETASSTGAGISILSPSSTSGNIFFGDESDNYVGGLRYFHTTNQLDINVNNALALTIDSSRNVGIGTSSPTAKLEIYGSGSTVLDIQGSQGQLFSVTDDLTGDLFSVSDISGIPILNVNASGDSYFDGNLETTGNQTIGGILTVQGEIQGKADIIAYHSSDERLKENIKPIDNATDKVKQIGGYTFDWKSDIENITSRSGNDIGLIAQEVEKVIPQVVTTRSNGYKGVDYQKLVALLIESNKELASRIEELEKKIQ
jgi:hypothetical protein